MGIDHNKTWRLDPLGASGRPCASPCEVSTHGERAPSGYGEVMGLYLHVHWDTFVMFSGAVPVLRFLSGYISPYGSRSKGPCKEFYVCEGRACYVGNPRDSFFSSSRKICFIRESFANIGYYESLSLYTLQHAKGYQLLPPGVLQENGTAP